jgi:hypothetical protein
MTTAPVEADVERAAFHAEQAERLLIGRLGLISSYAKAQAHATLAVYYATRRRTDEG